MPSLAGCSCKHIGKNNDIAYINVEHLSINSISFWPLNRLTTPEAIGVDLFITSGSACVMDQSLPWQQGNLRSDHLVCHQARQGKYDLI